MGGFQGLQVRRSVNKDRLWAPQKVYKETPMSAQGRPNVPQDAQMAPQRLPQWSKIAANMCQESMIKFDSDFYQFVIRFSVKNYKICVVFCLIFLPVTHRLMERKH